MSLYDILGINKDASEEDIKKAHRKQVKQHHPDAGGTKESYQQVQLAYDVLKDKSRREKYDSTGETEKPRDAFQEKFAEFIAMVIIPKLEEAKSLEIDIITFGCKHISKAIAQAEESVTEGTRRVKRLNQAMTKLSKKSDKSPNIMLSLLQNKVDNYNKQINELNTSIEFLNKASDELQDYTYDFNQEEEQESKSFGWTFSSNL